MSHPKILVFDIETAPITAYTWGLWKQNIGLNMIKHDWHFLSWGAKWYGEPASRVMYMDNRKAKNVRNDEKLIRGLWKLLDAADIVITQNGEKFDIRKFNARAIEYGLPPVSHFRSTDTLKESRRSFAFTSHKLEYMTNKINKKYKKLKHSEFPGFELWSEVLKGNQRAWQVMKTYCIHDVLATEELYENIQSWIRTQNMANYFDDAKVRCRKCGSDNLVKDGPVYTDVGKFQGYQCRNVIKGRRCNARPRGNRNLFDKHKKRNQLKETRYAG